MGYEDGIYRIGILRHGNRLFVLRVPFGHHTRTGSGNQRTVSCARHTIYQCYQRPDLWAQYLFPQSIDSGISAYRMSVNRIMSGTYGDEY